MNNNLFHELRDVWIVHLGNHCDPLHQRMATAVDFHDVFGLIKAYLEMWYLPCIIICWADPEEITGLRLLAIGSMAAVNWLSTMLGNPELMTEYFRFAGIHFTSDSHSAIASPKEQCALPPCHPIRQTGWSHAPNYRFPCLKQCREHQHYLTLTVIPT